VTSSNSAKALEASFSIWFSIISCYKRGELIVRFF
jgi:hypothetical protein